MDDRGKTPSLNETMPFCLGIFVLNWDRPLTTTVGSV
jgi:hypothetical protein